MEMEAFVNRIFMFMETMNLSQNQFEQNCGLTHTDLRGKKQGPTASYLMKILSTYPQLSMDWLFRGTGSMLLGESSQPDIQTTHKFVLHDIHDNPIVNINYLQDAIKGAIKEAYREIQNEKI